MMRKSFSSLSIFSRSLQNSFGTKTPVLPNFSYTPKPYDGVSYEEVQRLRKSHLSPGIFAYYKKPVLISEGKMQYLYDHTGRRYLDFFAGIVTVSVGHSHPEIVKAGTEQLEKIMHTTTIYYNNQIAEFAGELAKKMPGNLKVGYFVNSGSEANDLAMLMAKLYTGSNDIIALRNCYHGMNMTQMGVTALHTWKFPVSQGSGVHHALNPDTYRGPFLGDPNATKKYANDVKDLIQAATPGKVAAFIAETIQGVGGTVVLPEGYLKEVYSHVRAAGGLCIADEVQTGFGRLGTHFWGFETQGVQPDIVTMAKGIGNGIPLAAVWTTPEIAATISQRIHFNTYGGNPLSCAIGRAVLRVLEKENIQQKALERGDYLMKGLRALQTKYPNVIGDIRGKGLMLGLELVTNPETKQPLAKEDMANFFEMTKDLGLLVGKGGLYGNVLRIKPPMCIENKDIDFACEVLDQSLATIKV